MTVNDAFKEGVMEIILDCYSADIAIEIRCPDCKAFVSLSGRSGGPWFESDKHAVLPFECSGCHSSGHISITLK